MDTAAPALPMLVPVTDPEPEIAFLARRWRRANGPLISLMNKIGGQIEGMLNTLPTGLRDRLDEATAAALEHAMTVAHLGRHAPRTGPVGAPALAALTGAAGGAGGLATSLAELPVTLTLILHAIARAAEAEGFDPADPRVRAECLRVLAAGSPLAQDDAVDTAFLGARLALSGAAVQKLVQTLAPGVAAAMTRKLAAQAVPVLGAVTGAALNALYLRYYRELAHVRFGLLRLAEAHGAPRVAEAFALSTTPRRLRKA